MAILIAILEEKLSVISGKVSLPDGTVFPITQEGLNDMKKRLITILGRTPSANASNASPQTGTNVFDVIKEAMKHPEDTGKLVREIASALRGDPQVALEETKQVSRFTLAIMCLMGVVIVSASVLAYFGRLSGDAVGLVFGTVIGSSFAFLYKYLAPPEESNS